MSWNGKSNQSHKFFFTILHLYKYTPFLIVLSDCTTFAKPDSSEIWNTCDVLITANPDLLAMKPDKKISVKIDTDYNEKAKSDFSYSSMKKFVESEDNVNEIIKKIEENEGR